jgi:hypothetical protein
MSASTPDDLQFAKAEPTSYSIDSLRTQGESPSNVCADCQKPIAQYYFEANGRVLCAACKGKLERALAGDGTSRAGRITKALAYGFGAALLGAAIWFGVAVAFNLEIGLVAILIGFMVGKAVRAGSADRGGRRYQVAAALLTYLSVAMSYGALGIREMVNGQPTMEASADSTAARATAGATSATPAAVADDAEAGDAVAADTTTAGANAEAPSFAKAIAFMLGFMFLLPIVANVASMPGGIIGLAILAFGIHQAWQMNAAAQLSITGPHRLTTPGPEGAAQAAPAAPTP